ncbi:phage tail sheath C-terminal domain-containing protein [Parvularcula sp. LCG005]|uniref:phage tail sheath C-terminal domain-containing protein n=1 Tax=Parvularcula sp. LCG005 TaxID=3078805 RepID=UPI002943575D|nr:phage tail sheath C-terminal domain-containing protein [Parvularcula sp. LCG005]WOI53417.1 phage tail sheath C-terminal domain-containing protein [Parvularcula sp. LCG005]
MATSTSDRRRFLIGAAACPLALTAGNAANARGIPPTFKAPGVYVEEVPSGVRSITGVKTGVCLLIDHFGDAVPDHVPIELFGTDTLSPVAADAVEAERLARFNLEQVFDQGGRSAVIINVPLTPDGLPDYDAGLATAMADDALIFDILYFPSVFRILQNSELRMTGLYRAAADWCTDQMAILILDAPDTIMEAARWARYVAPQSVDAIAYGARIVSPADPALVAGAGGAAAGIIARTDRLRGVWKAPAGLSADLTGLSLASAPSQKTRDILSASYNINTLIKATDGAPVLWGARTLGGSALSAEYRYVSTRRLHHYIHRSLSQGLAWTAFEPNEKALWNTVTLAVSAFMQNLFVQGAFAGATARQSYTVACGINTMTAADQLAGRLMLEIGFAPARPAEFVILRMAFDVQSA